MTQCLVRAFATLSLLWLWSAAEPARALTIGFDNRNGIEPASVLYSGSNFDELRALVAGIGHTIVPVASFDSASLAGIQALYLSQPYTQSGGGLGGAEVADIQAFVANGGGLVLLADAGVEFEAASLNSLASAFGVSFAAAGTQDDGHEILLFNTHPLTTGLGPLPGSGLCVDFQRS